MTPEEQAAADAVAAAAKKKAAEGGNPEPGNEPIHNKKYLDELREENRKRRENEEKLAKERDELQKFKEETEAQKLKDEKKFEELANKEKAAREKAEKDAAEKVTAYERRAIKAEVKSLAIAAGLEDPDDVELIDLSSIKYEDDKIVGADAVVEEFKKAKPHKFTDDKSKRGRGGLSTGGNPDPGGKKGEVDFRKMTAADQANLEQELRSKR